MKNVMIITYAYAPLNVVSVWRQYYRAKYLIRCGYKVTILTRHWKENQEIKDHLNTVEDYVHLEVGDFGEQIIRLPAGIRHAKYRSIGQRALRALYLGRLPLVSKIIEQLAYYFLPLEFHKRLASDREQLFEKVSDVPDIVIASGDPWSNFEVGIMLKYHYKCKLVFEYRDPWNYIDQTTKIVGYNTYNDNWNSRLKRSFAIKRERRLARHADALISVSDHWVNEIGAATRISPRVTIRNGFEPDEFVAVTTETYEKFTITYVGTIHTPPQQDITVFLDGLQILFQNHPELIKQMEFRMLGSSPSHNFVKTALLFKEYSYYDEVVRIIEKKSKSESIQMQKSSQLLLFIAHGQVRGQYPAKIFEYIGSENPILLVPSDNDVIAAIISNTGCGIVCNNPKEVSFALKVAFDNWINKKPIIKGKGEDHDLTPYTYAYQNKKLSQFLSQL